MGNISSCLGKPPAVLAETSSRCATPTATAAHNFIVENYSLLDGMGVGKFVSSTTFSVGANNWNIRFYPDGDGEEPAGYASAFLHLNGGAGATGVKAKFTLSLLGKDGKVFKDTKPVSISQIFETGGVHSTWGVLKFVEKSTLQEADCFTVRCDLTVLKEAVVQKM
jgi:speckle-type POZ protein